MKILLDFLPVLLFFVAYKVADIYVAAGVAIAVALGQIVWCLVKRTPIKPVQWLSLGFLVIFGGATILLHNPYYIKVKWTLFYGLMGLLMLGALLVNKSPLKALLGQEIELPELAWRQLSIAWGCFFLVMAALNQYFATVLSLEAWVNVKIFGGSALIFLFSVAQVFWLARNFPEYFADKPDDLPKDVSKEIS